MQSRKPISFNSILSKDQSPSVGASIFFDRRKHQSNYIVQIDQFSSVYDQAELADYFQLLQKFLNKPNSPDQLAYIILHAENNEIMIGFNIQNQQWAFFDAFVAAVQPVQTNQLANLIYKSMSENSKHLIFRTEIFAEIQCSEKIRTEILAMKNDQAFIKLQKVCEVKALSQNNHQVTWLYHAVKNGEISVVKELLLKGANPNQFTKNHSTPFLLAVKMDQYEIVKMMLDFDSAMISFITKHEELFERKVIAKVISELFDIYKWLHTIQQLAQIFPNQHRSKAITHLKECIRMQDNLTEIQAIVDFFVELDGRAISFFHAKKNPGVLEVLDPNKITLLIQCAEATYQKFIQCIQIQTLPNILLEFEQKIKSINRVNLLQQANIFKESVDDSNDEDLVLSSRTIAQKNVH